MGWDKKQGKWTRSFDVLNINALVEDLIYEMDPNHDGVITEEEFSVICKYISQRGNPSFPPIGGSKSGTSRTGTQAI